MVTLIVWDEPPILEIYWYLFEGIFIKRRIIESLGYKLLLKQHPFFESGFATTTEHS